ncbi:MAG: SOS response-associated peptidase [Alphaproteobacteria bacterium]|nr:SOS response-associated peptidase [Alphaproteobacteria bacterium]
MDLDLNAMCGRFTNRYSWRELKALYELSDVLYPQSPSNFEPRYNIAPTQTTFVVRMRPDGRRELAQLRWGLLPAWAKSLRDGARMINARCETVATSRAYKAAFVARPCLVVADGFYEWAATGTTQKQPYFLQRRNAAPFAFAGVWETRHLSEEDTFTIITCPANRMVSAVHDRMPLMLAPGDWPAWLGSLEARTACLSRPLPAEDMEMWPVGRAVGSPKNQGPSLIAPIAL